MFLSRVLRGELLQFYFVSSFVINVTGLVQFVKELSYILALRIICCRVSP